MVDGCSDGVAVGGGVVYFDVCVFVSAGHSADSLGDVFGVVALRDNVGGHCYVGVPF